jgi:hypothetical protein
LIELGSINDPESFGIASAEVEDEVKDSAASGPIVALAHQVFPARAWFG